MYTNMTTHLLNELKDRLLDRYYELGISIINNRGLQQKDKSALTELFQAKESKDSDKVRLLLLYIICDTRGTKSDFDTFFKQANIQDKNYLKLVQLFAEKSGKYSKPESENNGESEKQISSLIKGLASSVKNRSKDLLMNVQSQFNNQEGRYALTEIIYQFLKSIQKNDPLNDKKTFEVFDTLSGKSV